MKGTTKGKGKTEIADGEPSGWGNRDHATAALALPCLASHQFCRFSWTNFPYTTIYLTATLLRPELMVPAIAARNPKRLVAYE